MRRVLLIAYYFPPIGGSGTQRPAKFVKYLQDFGWQPYVISAAQAQMRAIAEDKFDERQMVRQISDSIEKGARR